MIRTGANLCEEFVELMEKCIVPTLPSLYLHNVELKKMEDEGLGVGFKKLKSPR
jgi:hypothetical protein